MLSIFANLRINDSERFEHFKASLSTISDISDDWLINVRGKYREPALEILKNTLGGKATFFELLDDSRGWVNNALQMLPKAKHEYVLIWLEDHINTAPQDTYQKIAREMSDKKADYLMYSWWIFGQARDSFERLQIQHGENIDLVHITPQEWRKLLKLGVNSYLVSLCGIFRKDFLLKLFLKDRWKLPLFFTKNLYRVLVVLTYLGFRFDRKKAFHAINNLLGNILPWFSQETPFNLEKGPWRTDILPLTLALPKRELFACIDDDLGITGYQLIKRGLYPLNPELNINDINTLQMSDPGRINEKIIEQNHDYTACHIVLPKGTNYGKVYYENVNRTGHLLSKTITVIKGEIEVEVRGKKASLRPGQSTTVHPNTRHSVKALEDSSLVVCFTSLHNKDIQFESQVWK